MALLIGDDPAGRSRCGAIFMSLAFHHFFVFVEPGARAVDELIAAGFSEGSRNTHPGQGTANRRVFFANGMLEFIWVEKTEDASSAATAPTKLWERSEYLKTGYSPFGLAVCPDATSNEPSGQPFLGWSYRPRYLPGSYSIWNGSNDDYPWEPMIFYLSFTKPYQSLGQNSEPTQHANGAHWLQSIRITTVPPRANIAESDAKTKVTSIPMIEWLTGDRPQAEIIVAGSTNHEIDLSRWCPITIRLVAKTR